MNKKILTIFVIMLFFTTAFLSYSKTENATKILEQTNQENQDDYCNCVSTWPPSGWSETVYSGGGHWNPKSVDNSNMDPYNAEDCYAIAKSDDNINAFNVGLFSPSLDLSAENSVTLECGLSFDTGSCSSSAQINVYSSGSLEYGFGPWTSTMGQFPFNGILDVGILTDPSDVLFEFYYTTNGNTNCGFFSVDNVEVYGQMGPYLEEDFGICGCEIDDADILVISNENQVTQCNGGPAVHADPTPSTVWENSNALQILEQTIGAQWIWNNTGGKTFGSNEALDFCQDFTLDCDCSHVTLYIATDNRAKIWINDIPLSSNTWDTTLLWLYVDEIEIPCDPFLHQGTNTLKIRVGNTGSGSNNYAGAIWCLAVCCEPCIADVEIDKKIYDPVSQSWVDDLLNANIPACTPVSYKIIVTNTGTTPISEFTVFDDVSGCLGYIDGSASVTPDIQNGNTLKWFYTNPGIPNVLQPDQSFEIEFDVNILNYLTCANCVEIYHAIGEDCGPPEGLTDKDCATISTECDQTAFIDLKVWNPNSNQWADSITAEMGDTLLFNISLYNQGNDDILAAGVDAILPKCFDYEQGSANVPISDYDEGSYPDKNIIHWLYTIDIEPCETIYLTYEVKINCIVIDPTVYQNDADMAYIGCFVEKYDNDDLDVTVKYPEADPDLEVFGDLFWINLQPGETAEAELELINAGEEGSSLNWSISEYPEWGTWNFDPSEGYNLKPEDGPVQVEVEVEAPDEKDEEFEGTVKIINTENAEDYIIIPVTLSTPKYKQYNIPFLQLIERILQRYQLLFPIIIKILNL